MMKNMPFAVVEGAPGSYSLAATGTIRGPIGNSGEHLVCFAGSGYSYNRVVSPQYMGQMLIFDTPGQLQAFLQAEVFKDQPAAPAANEEPALVEYADTTEKAPDITDAGGDQMVQSALQQVGP